MEEINYQENNQVYSVNMGLPDLRNLIGWATFCAIMDIIVGALSCFGIITAAYGVPQIIAGTKLLNACNEMKRYIETNDYQRISETFIGFNGYFRLSGISTIVKIAFYVVFIILYVVFIIALVTNMPHFLQNLQ